MQQLVILLGVAIGSGCAAEVVLDDEPVLERGEGGYLGTGESDREGAISEACDAYRARLPQCPHDRCLQSGREKLTLGELTNCSEEALELFYCSVTKANATVCLGHHGCDDLYGAFDDCVFRYCVDNECNF